jgi:2-methylcitrate dehydratase PrpD
LREKIEVATDETFRKDQASAAIITATGERYAAMIEHASGTVDNPMSDDTIEAKFIANASAAVGAERAQKIAALVWRLDTLTDVRSVVELCADS